MVPVRMLQNHISYNIKITIIIIILVWLITIPCTKITLGSGTKMSMLFNHPSQPTVLAALIFAMGTGMPVDAQDTGNATQLAPVTVVGSSGEPTGYVAEQSSTATKADTPLIEVPQSISVITEDQMRQQGAQTLNPVLRYT